MSNVPTIAADDEVVGLRVAAAELGVCRATAWTWALRGRLPARDVGGRFVVRRVDLEALKGTLEDRAAAQAT